jgi:hypothetical protein
LGDGCGDGDGGSGGCGGGGCGSGGSMLVVEGIIDGDSSKMMVVMLCQTLSHTVQLVFKGGEQVEERAFAATFTMQALKKLQSAVTPDTILACYRTRFKFWRLYCKSKEPRA